MLRRALALLSVVSCALILVSFTLFARDQAAGASAQQQQTELASAPPVAPSQPHPHGQPRRLIDGAASALTTPFNSIVRSNNAWVDHGLPTVFALIVYGAGLSFVARFVSTRA